ncbi:hypothetical protein DES40_2083 [Litorimonas taeanensis]|uniref:Uncharacterized protein n=1 Tax=Litorimonas taeanensis TaxID=568099 RepID=A0A420WE33_9PROT|nr:hypothetical protein [Litorimonas taeanensis]RKQ69284.1 hypothetical protein DES40_2083 [Litorimonas taeanensis]
MRSFILILSVWLLSGAVALAQAGTASSSTEAPEWSHTSFRMQFTGNAVKLDNLGQVFEGEALFTNYPEKKGNVAFSCLTSTLTANIGLVPVDFEAYFREFPRSRRGKVKLPYLYINGEKVKSGQWIYAPNLKIYMPRKKHVVGKLYNAAIRGDSVTLSTNDKDHIPLILPKPNANFANFGAGCGIGKHAA